MTWTRICLLLAIVPTVAEARQPPPVSWGKAGVDFASYRRDAVECAVQGATADVADLEATKRFVHVHNALDVELNGRGSHGSAYQDLIRRHRPDERIKEVGNHLHDVVAVCLTERGYSRFALNAKQVKDLKRLPTGSDNRHRYMHALASNGTVLASQRTD